MIRTLFEWISMLSSSVALREAFNVYPWLLTAHVVSTTIFAGLIIMMDLRLAGIGNLSTPFVQTQKRLFPWQMATMGLSSLTGGLLFYGDPMRFYPNFYFWLKMLLMVLAGVNAFVFHMTVYERALARIEAKLTEARSWVSWDFSGLVPFEARVAGLLSLVLWASIIITGRMIAYSALVPQWWLDLGLS